MLQSVTPGRHLVFARNPHFWARDEAGRQLPYLDEIELRIVPEQNAEVLQLESGAVDLINDGVRPEDLAALRRREEAGELQLVDAGVAVNADGLWFNLVPGAAATAGRPWFRRVEFRQAISHAVDRRALVETVYLGAAEPVFGPVTPGYGKWHSSDIPETPFDRERARALLSGIGIGDRNGDGHLEDASGRPVRFSVLTQKGHTGRERSVSMIQEHLRHVGITVDIVTSDPNTLFGRFSQADYETMFFGFSTPTVDPASTLDFWLSSGPMHFWHPRQSSPSTTWEARIDDLMRRQTASLDPAERLRLFVEAQRTLASERPILYFAAPRVSIAMSARIRGATPSVLSPPVLWNAEVLSIDSTTAGRSIR